jgi:hypothetical protein
MEARISAPLLSRVKSWQLVGLGISGWVTLYSAAVLTWGTSSTVIGNAQGGCFAVTMTLAGLEASRFKNRKLISTDPLQWASAITTEQLNQTITQVVQEQDYSIEAPHPSEVQMGFGVRAVHAGRTWVFETGRWKEPIIDLPHARNTEENRKRVFADYAVIVGAGTPDEDTRLFVKFHPVQLLVGKELKNMLPAEVSSVQAPETQPDSAPQALTVCNDESGQAEIKAET